MSDAQTTPVLDRDALTEYAERSVSAVFGPRFQRLDDLHRRLRLPRDPMLILDRITGIEGQPAARGSGLIRSETEVRPDSWFLDPGGRMPACLMAEAMQAMVPLATYLGLDLDGNGDRVLRVLDAHVTFHGSRPRAGQTLRHKFWITSHVEHGDLIIMNCGGESRVDDEPRLTISKLQGGIYGKPVTALGNTGKGLAWDPAAIVLDESRPFRLPDGVCATRRFGSDQVRAFADGSPAGCFGPAWPASDGPLLQSGPLRMLHEVTEFDPAGGPWRRGYLRAACPVAPDDWYFAAHFPNDPCMPGCLMMQFGLQAMSFYLAALGYTRGRDGWEFDVVPEHTYRARFRGEASPATKLMTCELFVSSVTDLPYPTLHADILISVDGVKTAHLPGAAMRLAPKAMRLAPKAMCLAPNKQDKPGVRKKPVAEHHVLTGGTGFIGSAIALELLDKTGATITCLARPRPGLSADDRVKRALRTTAELFGRPDLTGQIDRRCRGVNGDVSQPACGVDLDALGRADQVWHLAALLAFEDHRKDEVFRQNIDGTRNVLELARRASARCFNHVSTAYVAGKRSGPIAEEPADEDTECNNWYEASKIAAEREVQASSLPVIRIMRPSIVIGHSQTLATTSASAVYGGARGLSMARSRLIDTVGDVLATRVWRVNGDPDAELNLIPVDRVVTAAVGLVTAEAPSGIYHLTNARNTTIGEFTKAMCEVVGVREPVFVDDDSGFSLVDRLVNDYVSIFRPYLRGAKKFGMDRVRAHVDGPVLEFATPQPVLADLLRWYIDRDTVVQGGNAAKRML
jgi:nucleoside-diphosphate-sugar epimerase/3-hydroxymyristoyl/3-hydroxydecanoyl-(acyl carrier protein) dehydratase